MIQDTDTIGFGVHKGKMMQDVPDGYFIWLYSKSPDLKRENPDLFDYIVRNANAMPDLILRAEDKNYVAVSKNIKLPITQKVNSKIPSRS